MSLVARHLEHAGISTVVLGSARDIVEHCGVARFAFTDFPLGNPCGVPGDQAMQQRVVEAAVELFETTSSPRTTRWLQEVFAADTALDTQWRRSYAEVKPEDAERLKAAGDARRAARAAVKP